MNMIKKFTRRRNGSGTDASCSEATKRETCTKDACCSYKEENMYSDACCSYKEGNMYS
jgi:hypothetical protein